MRSGGAQRPRWALPVVLVGLAVLGGVVFMVTRRGGAGVGVEDRQARGPADGPATPGRLRMRGRDAGTERPEPPPEPADASADFTVPPETAALVDDAHEHLQDAARPCLSRVRTKLRHKGLFLQFQYTLTIERGQAHPAGLAVQNTDMTDPALVACIVEELQQARWIAGAAGSNTSATVTVDDTLTLGDLQ